MDPRQLQDCVALLFAAAQRLPNASPVFGGGGRLVEALLRQLRLCDHLQRGRLPHDVLFLLQRSLSNCLTESRTKSRTTYIRV